MFQTDVTTIIGEGAHGRLTEWTSLVNLDILSMCCEHVLLVLLLVGKLQRAEAAQELVVLFHVAEIVGETSDHILAMWASSVHLDVGLVSSYGMFLQFGLAGKLQVTVRDWTREPVVPKYVGPEVAEGANLLTTHGTRLINLDIEAVRCQGVLLQLLLAGKLELAVGHLADPVVLLADVPIVVSEATLNCSTLTARLVHPEAKRQSEYKRMRNRRTLCPSRAH